MASIKVASALTILTSEQFTPSDITDNNALEAFVLENFTGSGKITDDDDSEGNDNAAAASAAATNYIHCYY